MSKVVKKVLISGSAEIPKEKVSKIIGEIDLVVAADGGYNRLTDIGVSPSVVIGDMDSVGEISSDISKISFPSDKDESDLKLSMDYVFSKYPEVEEIYLTGVVSDTRLDHLFSNIFTLFNYDFNFEVLTSSSNFKVLNSPGSFKLNSKVGDRVSIIEIQKGSISAEGLKFPLPDSFKSPSHGISNETVLEEVSFEIGMGKYIIFLYEGSSY